MWVGARRRWRISLTAILLGEARPSPGGTPPRRSSAGPREAGGIPYTHPPTIPLTVRIFHDEIHYILLGFQEEPLPNFFDTFCIILIKCEAYHWGNCVGSPSMLGSNPSQYTLKVFFTHHCPTPVENPGGGVRAPPPPFFFFWGGGVIWSIML